MKIVEREDGQWEVIDAAGNVLSEKPFASFAAAEAWVKSRTTQVVEGGINAFNALKASVRAGSKAAKDPDDEDDGGGSSPPLTSSPRP